MKKIRFIKKEITKCQECPYLEIISLKNNKTQYKCKYKPELFMKKIDTYGLTSIRYKNNMLRIWFRCYCTLDDGKKEEK